MKMKISKTLAVLASILICTFARSETRYGLFIGINEYTQGANYLDGCDWDAMRMLDAWTTGGTAQPANCALLASTDATKAALRERFNALAVKAVSGDVVLYYHSGHGGNYDDKGGSFLCATDDDWYDYEFAEDLERFASGVKVIVVIDACNSGGMFKSAKGGGAWAFAANVRRIMSKRRQQKKAAGDPAEVAWVTAADSDETSSMEGRGSEFTHRFLEGWEDASADSDENGIVTFGELAKYAKPLVKESNVQSYNDSMLAAVAAGHAFDVAAYRTLAFAGRFYGFFGDCPASIAIPDGIAEIADSAFDADDCDTSDNLQEVTLPASLRKIGRYAFYGCENLETVTFLGDRSAVSIGKGAFNDTPAYATIFTPPANDNFADAETLPATESGTFSGTTEAATIEEDEFLWDYDDVDCTVWYKWTAPNDGVVVITPTLDETECLVGVTTGIVTRAVDGDEWQEWSELGIRWLYLYEDDEEISRLSFKCTARTTYYISVGQYSGDGADFAFSWEIRMPPANDAFANATVISGAEGTINGSNVGATDDDPQDGMSSDIGSSTIWYKWTAPATDNYEFNTFGSRFDTMIYIVAETDEEDEEWGFYEGVASNDDASGSDYNESAVYFEAEQGVTYWICVSGYDYEIGDITLNWKKSVFELVVSDGVLTGYRGVLPDALDLTGTGITAINSWLFSGKSLSSVILPETLESIGEGAFRWCNNLSSISIPATVTTIGNQAFENCTSLETVTFEGEDGEDGIAMDRDSAFYNTPWLLGPFSMSVDEDGTLLVSGYVPSVVEIPEGTVTIPSEAFANATRLTQVTIPDTVTQIESRAFYNCYNLVSVVVPASVEGINDGAFYGCSRLTRVSIPETLEGTIDEESAFDGCPAVIEYYEVPHFVLTLDPAYDGAETLSKKVAFDALNIGDMPWPTRPGYVFRGWWTSPDDTGWRVYDDASPSDLGGIDTLYAHWAEIIYTWNYSVNDQGGATINGLSSRTADGEYASPSGHLEIPDTIDGYIVTALGSYLCSYNDNVTSVRLPAGLTPGSDGGNWAFSYLYNLQTVYAPETCAEYESDLRSYIFPGCPESFVFEYYAPEYTTVTLVPGDGATISATEINTLGAVGNLPIPTRDGYDFMGWWTAPDGGEWLAPETTLDSDITAYAHWQERTLWFTTQPYYLNGSQIGVSITSGEWWSRAVSDANGNYPTGRVVVPYGIDGQPVVEIGSCAFVDCRDVTEVILPPTVREIGGCAFYNCNSLSTVTLPQSLRTIRYDAFTECYALASIAIPASVEIIEISAFKGCSSLREFTVASGNANYKTVDGVLYTSDGGTLVACPCGMGGAARVADGTRFIGQYAFYDSPISSVSLPNTLERIEYEAFYSCENLTTIDIPSSVTYIGSDAFAYSGLVAGGVSIGNPDAHIEISAFRNTQYDASLPFSMYVSDGVVTGFTGGCPASLDIGEAANGQTVSEIGDYAFHGSNHDMTPLESVVIPENVTHIGSYALCSCSNLRVVTLPSTLKTIESDAFNGCDSLANLIIPASVEYIGSSAFSYCYQLREITIPASVTDIGYNAFYGCSGLQVAYVPSALQSKVESNYVFDGCYNVEIRYYDGDAPEFATVTLDWNDGSGNTEQMKFFQVYDDLPLPRTEGYSVEGWYLEPECANRVADGDTAEDGITLYARWVETVYEFTNYYDNGDGTITLTSGYEEQYDPMLGWYGYSVPCVSPSPYGRFEVPAEIVGMTVASIGDSAFTGCYEMTEIVIPAGVTSISANAFNGCSALTSIVVADDNQNYSSRDGFLYDKSGETLILCPPGRGGDIIVPEGTRYIGQNAFRYNNRITSVELAEGVETIGYGAFDSCTALETVTFPSSLRMIETYAFCDCGALQGLDFKVGLENIGSGAFLRCSSLGYVNFPQGLRVIDMIAFAHCDNENFTSVTIPSSVENVESEAFIWCSSLVDVSYSETTSVAVSAFDRTPWGEANVEFSLGIDVYGWDYGYSPGYLYGYHGRCPAHLEIPSTAKIIGGSVFKDTTSLVSVFIPASVTDIESSAFANCINLSEVIMPSTLRNDWIIGEVFYGCPNISITYYHQVTFDPGDKGTLAGGEAVQLLDEGESAVAPTVAAKPGWRFIGWDGDFSSETASITVHALYESTVELSIESEATAGKEFVAHLTADGIGDGFTWSLAGGTAYSVATNSAAQFVAQDGAGLGLVDDDVYTSYELPFSFPLFGREYATVYPNSNGAIFFVSGHSNYYYDESVFKSNPMIAGMWRDMYDGDVYVSTGSGAATFRWSSSYNSGHGNTSMSITLYADGRIVCAYGSGNAAGGAVGISSGDGENFVLCSDGSATSSMENLGEIAFAPMGGIPDGLELSADGKISGVPQESGDFTLRVALCENGEVVSMFPVTLHIESAGGVQDVVSEDVAYASGDAMPAILNVVAGVSVSVAVDAAPDAAALAALAQRVAVARGHEGQDAGYFKTTAKYDAQAGVVVVKAEIDEDAVGLSDAAAEIVSAQNLANLADGAGVTLENVVDGFYYGIAVADTIEGVKAATASGVALERAEVGLVEIDVARPAGGSAFFRVVVSDRP